MSLCHFSGYGAVAYLLEDPTTTTAQEEKEEGEEDECNLFARVAKISPD